MIRARGKASRSYDRPELEDIGAKIPNKPRVKASKKGKKNRKGNRRRRDKVEYHAYMKSKVWKRKREQALEYYGRKCAECSKKESLTVHHLTYKNLGNEPMKDLQVLCKCCHSILHENKYPETNSMWTEFNNIVAATA